MFVKTGVFIFLVHLLVTISWGQKLPQVLTLAERLKIFGTGSTFSHFIRNNHITVPDIEYATIRELNTSDLKPFRKRPVNVIQYEMTLDNETFILTLRPNKYLTSPGCLVKNFSNQTKEPDIYPCEKDRINCFYTGSSDSHNESWVAADVCGGLKGVISIGNTSRFIHPIIDGLDILTPQGVTRQNFHVVYRYQSEKKVCRFEGETFNVVEPKLHGRRKRQVSGTRYVETSLVVDPSMARFHGDDRQSIINYVLTVTNIAYKLFRDPSLGSNIHLVVSEIIILPPNTGLNISSDAGSTLTSFCHWKQTKENTADISRIKDKHTSDISVLLTRIDIEFGGDRDTTGLAKIGGACSDYQKCAIVEDNGPSMGITLAHEIGHLLGMVHDKDNNNCSAKLMSPKGQSGKEAFKWSACSANELKQFLQNLKDGMLECLTNVPLGFDESKQSLTAAPLPGTIYDANSQCTMHLRRDAVFCPYYNDDPCTNQICAEGTRCYNKARQYSQPFLDGTDCNNTRTWCIAGTCIAMNDTFGTPPVDGSWSNWDASFTSCSATCGGGIKTKSRRCNNPVPQYGGKQCTGESVMSELCNLEKCGDKDFKLEQCIEKTISLGSEYRDWAPRRNLYGNNDCFLDCYGTRYSPDGTQVMIEVGGSESIYYKDGTGCQLMEIDTPFSRCLKGICRRYGCDAKMDSLLRYDGCGKCGGNWTTCRNMTKTYTGRIRFNINKHQSIVDIPKGSTGISLVQNNTNVFIEILINNDTIISEPSITKTTLFEANGMRILYEVNPERIHINGPIPHGLLILTSIKPGRYPNSDELFSITCTYHVPLSATPISRYYWALNVQPCTLSCGRGVMPRVIECWSTHGPVDDYLCDINNKPNEKADSCNSFPCPPRWHPSDWGPCSVTCGDGFQSRSFACRQFDNGTDKDVDKSRCSFGHSPPTVACNNGLCPGIWRIVSKSECSKSCGKGILTQTVLCFQDENSTIALDERHCLKAGKPPTQKIECNNGPCKSSFYCADRISICDRYGADICYGEYIQWAEFNCPASCGICERKDFPVCQIYINRNLWRDGCHKSNRTASDCPNMCHSCNGCEDKPENNFPCNQVDRTFCTDPQYLDFLKKHCAKHCCLCDDV